MSYCIRRFHMQLTDLPMKEVRRYIGHKGEDARVDDEIRRLMPSFLESVECRACWMEVPVTLREGALDFDVIKVNSNALAANLKGCSRAILLAATIGSEADRKRRAAGITSPMQGLLLDGMGSAAIECLCDGLCEKLQSEYQARLRPRFSPGYGDLPLAMQSELLQVLDSQRQIGLSLTEELMMLPQKSVTAIVGLPDG